MVSLDYGVSRRLKRTPYPATETHTSGSMVSLRTSGKRPGPSISDISHTPWRLRFGWLVRSGRRPRFVGQHRAYTPPEPYFQMCSTATVRSDPGSTAENNGSTDRPAPYSAWYSWPSNPSAVLCPSIHYGRRIPPDHFARYELYRKTTGVHTPSSLRRSPMRVPSPSCLPAERTQSGRTQVDLSRW